MNSRTELRRSRLRLSPTCRAPEPERPPLYCAHDELFGGYLGLQLLEALVNEVVSLDDQLEVSLQLDQPLFRSFEIGLVGRGLQVGRRDQCAGDQTCSEKGARGKAPALPSRHLPAPSR